MRLANTLSMLAISGLAIGLAGVARAQSTESFSHTTPVTVVQSTPFSDIFSLPDFNTNLGTLTAVQFDLNTNTGAEVAIFNPTNGALPFTNAFAQVPLTVVGPGGTSTSTSPSYNVASGNVTTFGITTYPGPTGSATSTVMVPTANFGMYESAGVGSFNTSVTATAGTGTYGGTDTHLAFGGYGLAGATTTVTYKYQPIPELGTFTQLGCMGLTSMGFLLRRRKK